MKVPAKRFIFQEEDMGKCICANTTRSLNKYKESIIVLLPEESSLGLVAGKQLKTFSTWLQEVPLCQTSSPFPTEERSERAHGSIHYSNPVAGAFSHWPRRADQIPGQASQTIAGRNLQSSSSQQSSSLQCKHLTRQSWDP